MILTPTATEKEHWAFIKSMQELDAIYGWKVISMSCGAYVWENKSKDATLYLTPYFEEYKRVCVTICPRRKDPMVLDPFPLRSELSTEDFHQIVTNIFNRIRVCERPKVATIFIDDKQNRFIVKNHLGCNFDVLIADNEEHALSLFAEKSDLNISKVISVGYTFEKDDVHQLTPTC